MIEKKMEKKLIKSFERKKQENEIVKSLNKYLLNTYHGSIMLSLKRNLENIMYLRLYSPRSQTWDKNQGQILDLGETPVEVVW